MSSSGRALIATWSHLLHDDGWAGRPNLLGEGKLVKDTFCGRKYSEEGTNNSLGHMQRDFIIIFHITQLTWCVPTHNSWGTMLSLLTKVAVTFGRCGE